MAAKTYAVHTTEDNIRRVDEHVNRLRRSRNSFINEAIEVLLEIYDAELREKTNQNNRKRKAGAR